MNVRRENVVLRAEPGQLHDQLRVDDLDAMLAQLRATGAVVDDKVDDSEYGRFGWCMDPEGNRLELWQPPASTLPSSDQGHAANAGSVTSPVPETVSVVFEHRSGVC